MAERDRLNAVLKKLAAGAPMASVSTEGTQHRLTDMLRAIDEIVLPRELEFSAGGKALTLSVAKRQVYAASGLVDADLHAFLVRIPWLYLAIVGLAPRR